MPRCCRRARSPPGLRAAARAATDEDAPMLFPMYTVSADRLLAMTKIDTHEELKARGDIVVFDDSLGNAGFISHQWVAKQHPDPEFKQMQILKDAMGLLLGGQGSISLDRMTEASVPTAKAMPYKELQSRPLFFWYDYFSVPQLERAADIGDMGHYGDQAKAINSIPAYVSKCRYFLALCPTMDCPSEGRVLNALSWARRGWCRVERASRELSEHDTWILIQSSTCLQVVGTALSFLGGSVGEGEFTVQGDRERLAPVMKAIVRRKLMLSLQARDWPSYRRHLNLQAVHLRGLDTEPIADLVPGLASTISKDSDPCWGNDLAADFLCQNGLSSISRKDSAGWRPLHYAALSGKVQLMEALLVHRADPNQRTSRDEPKLGFAPWISALDLAIFYQHNEAAQLLISARARLEGGIASSMVWAAMSGNAKGVRLLCEARGNAQAKNFLGVSALASAASFASLEAMDELIYQTHHSQLDLSRALYVSMFGWGGSAEVVERLVSLRADVNFQSELRRDWNRIGQLFMVTKMLQHRLGRTTVLTSQAYHSWGCTPLMAALQSAQYEGGAALIAEGAQLDIENSRGWTALTFARTQSIPQFVQQGLEGKSSECWRVYELALSFRV